VDSPVLPESNPPLRLLIEPLNLGPDVRAISLDLAEEGAESPAVGPEALAIWTAAIPALVADESWTLDFVSHLDRVREFCKLHEIHFREAAERCLVLPQPGETQLEEIFQRFEGETFGVRVGGPAKDGDPELEKALSHRGLDAYQPAYARYTCCAICEPEDGWVTLLSQTLWPTEVIRRVRPAAQKFDVYIARPH